MFSQIPSLKYLFWANLLQKVQNIWLEWNSTWRGIQGCKFWIREFISKFRPYNNFFWPFFDIFGPEISKCFIWNETRYKGVFGGADLEIDNCFLGKLWSQNFKVLCFKQNPVQWDIQVCKFWIQFFCRHFLISNTSEHHCCLFLTWNFRKWKPDACKNMSAVSLLYWFMVM